MKGNTQSERLMRVLYDATLFGGKDRSGVFRAVYEMARELGRSPECQLQFYVSDLFYLSTYRDVRDFVTAAPEMGHIPMLPLSCTRQLRVRMLSLHRKFFSRGRSLHLRVLRRLLYAGEGKVFYPDPTGGAEICHSAFLPIPEAIRRESSMHKFLTVYDLVPMHHPDWFAFDARSLVGKAIASVGPEGWCFCISESTRNDLLNYLPQMDPARVLVTPLAASDKFFPCEDESSQAAMQRRLGVPEGAQYFLSLCTLEPRKNLPHLVCCFARLLAETGARDLYLVLAGKEGWKYGPLLEAIEANDELRQRTLLSGYIEDEGLPPLYSGALAFVYPTLYEGFGLPPLEAMKCGAPVITSNTSSLPEVVGDAGIMVDPHDPDALCEAMLRVYRSPSLRQEMSAKSLRRAALFRWDKCASQVMAAYAAAMQA
jgi:glycosyltransferase involved in cell wall biosynthesis